MKVPQVGVSVREYARNDSVEFEVDNAHPPTDQIQQKLETNNVFLIARHQVDVGGVTQDLIYMSIKFINSFWVLVEVKAASGLASVGVRTVNIVDSIVYTL